MSFDTEVNTWSGVLTTEHGDVHLMVEQWLDEHGIRRTRAATKTESWHTWGPPTPLTSSVVSVPESCVECGHEVAKHKLVCQAPTGDARGGRQQRCRCSRSRITASLQPTGASS